MLFQGSIFPNPPKRNRFFLQINLIWKNINISLEIKIAMLKEMICNSLQSKTRLKIYSCQKERSKSDKKHCQRHNGPRVLSLIVLRLNRICIHFRYSQVEDSIAGSVVPPLELAANLATRWRLLH